MNGEFSMELHNVHLKVGNFTRYTLTHIQILELCHEGELPGECALKAAQLLNSGLEKEGNESSEGFSSLLFHFNEEILEDFCKNVDPDYQSIIRGLDSNLKFPPYTSIYDNARAKGDCEGASSAKRRLYIPNFFDGGTAVANIPLKNAVRRALLNSRNVHRSQLPKIANRKVTEPEKVEPEQSLTRTSTKDTIADVPPVEVKTLGVAQKTNKFVQPKPLSQVPAETKKPEPFVNRVPTTNKNYQIDLDKYSNRGTKDDPPTNKGANKSKKWNNMTPGEKRPGFTTGLDRLSTMIKEGTAKPIADVDLSKSSSTSYGNMSGVPRLGLPSNPNTLAAHSIADFNNYRPYQRANSRKEGPSLDPKYQALVTGDVTPEIITMVLDMKVLECEKIGRDDIVGLEDVKKVIIDKIVNPILMPSLHIGLFKAPKGILLFGPPGTGKTTIAKWIANVSNASFFEISPSSITSKFYGESESIIKTLFKVAVVEAPSLIFIDEVDAIMGTRKATDDDSSVRMKNQLLQMMDGINSGSISRDRETGEEKVVIVVGATNRPHMIDSAALRRFAKRILIPPPDHETRKKFIVDILNKRSSKSCSLTGRDLEKIAAATDGWTGCDLFNLCYKAGEYCYDDTVALFGGIQHVKSFEDFRAVEMVDIERALECTRPSTDESMDFYIDWSRKHGSV